MKRSIQIIVTSSLLTFVSVQNAMAASSTTVTDAVGTQELWTFEEVLGTQKMTSRINQVDGKGITQTWDANGNMLTRTDAEGRVMTYTYNATNQRTSMTEASGTPEARTTTYEYVNADIDLVTKTTSPSIFGTNTKDVINTYDANQNIRAVTINGFDAAGGSVSRATTFDYDIFGKVTKIDGPRTDIDDITTLEYYDCDTGAECGQLRQVTNAAGHISTYDNYDAAARLKQSTNPNGVVTTYEYHPRGWLLSMTQTPPTGAARITSYDYDKVGQLIKTTLPDGTEQNYVYDAAHDLREITDNVGNKVTYQYDAKGNRTDELVFDPSGTLVRSTITTYDIRNFISSINNGGSVTQLVNDAVGNLSTQTDPNENPSNEYEFDALDRLNSTVDSLTNTTSNTYDVADQLAQVVAPNGAVTQYEYDDLGNMTKEISADRGTISYTHDDAGNALSMTDARGITSTYQYDALNRMVSLSYPEADENVAYTYDQGEHCGVSVGNLCRVQDAVGEHFYEYDYWGNVLSHTWATDNNVQHVVLYQYDAADRVIKITYPSGLVVNYQRDVIGRVTQVQSVDGLVVETVANQFTYRADGLMNSRRLGNGQLEERAYDLQGRLLTQSLDGQVIASYEYDANGNVIEKELDQEQRIFEYDVLNRLTLDDYITGLGAEDDWLYGYDENGNRTTKQSNFSPVEPLAYQANSNRLTTINEQNIETDAAGNITSLPRTGDVLTLDYNQQAQLGSVTNEGGVTSAYNYNYQRQRMVKNQDQASSHYVYDMQGRLVATLSDDGQTYDEYIYARAVDYSPIQYRHYEQPSASTVEAQHAITQSQSLIETPTQSGQCEAIDTLSLLDFEGDDFSSTSGGSTTSNNSLDDQQLNAVLFIIVDYILTSSNDEESPKANDLELGVDELLSLQYPTIGFRQVSGATQYVVEVASSLVALNSNVDYLRRCGLTDNRFTISNAPLNGDALYIRVWAQVDGVWQYEDYQVQTSDLTASTRSVTKTYIVSDHLSTPRFGYDANKTLTWRWESDGFAAQAPNGDADNDGQFVNLNVRFPGQYYDEESGLYYNWNRYYDSEIGRYVTSDPIGLGGGLNTYGYVGGNPVVRIDIMGLLTFQLGVQIRLPSFPGSPTVRGSEDAKPRGVSLALGVSIPFFDGGDFDLGGTASASVGGDAGVGTGRVTGFFSASEGSLRDQRGESTSIGFNDGIGGLAVGLDELGRGTVSMQLGPGIEAFVDSSITGVLSSRDVLEFLSERFFGSDCRD